MASVIIQISKKSPQKELYEILCSLPNSPVPESKEEIPEISLELVITCLPNLFQEVDSQKIWERFTLIAYVFSNTENFLTLVSALENFSDSLQALTSLSFLYDLVSSNYFKFRIFKAIFKIVNKDHSNLILIQPHLLKIEEFIKTWTNVNSEELNEFIQDLLNLSVPENIKSRLITKLLADNELKTEKVDKLIGKLLNTTDNYDLEKILEYNSYKNASEKVKKLVSLLINASAPEVISFIHENGEWLRENGYDTEKVLEICRVSGLISLTYGNDTVSFTQIAERLSVNENEVDFWVVKAVSGGIIKVKIDAIEKIVTIEQRKFVADKKSALELLNRFEKALSS